MTLRDGVYLIGIVGLALIIVKGFWRPPKVRHPADRTGSSDINPPIGF